MHILIIEDDLLLALDLEECITELVRSSTSLASTEENALRLALKEPPDLILSDIRLADGDGLRAVRRIREALGQIPVIYVTANPERARMEDPEMPVVAKPFARKDLAEACSDLLPVQMMCF